MKKLCLAFALVAAATAMRAATTNITPWTPLFQGVDVSLGRVTNSGVQITAVNCLRVDLTAPGVRPFIASGCTNNCAPGTGEEVSAQNTSYFLEQYGAQVAVNGMFFTDAIGPGDVPLGTQLALFGLAISDGRLVSLQDEEAHSATMFFDSNNVPTFIPHNWPPVSSDGVFTAVTGNILLLTNGMNAATNVVDNDPRTAVGISEDKRYLYLMTVDGRQSGWSGGLNFYSTADWLARFGAFEGMAVDGGGSTTMVMADCQGKSIRLNRPSFLLQTSPPRERIIGNSIGIYAPPLPTEIKNLSVRPGSTTAILTWHTDFPATTQVEYGPTTSYGSATPLDSRLVHEHAVTLNSLISGSNYFFRALSSDGITTHSLACVFSTTSSVSSTLVFGLTNAWRFTTNSQDAIPSWKTRLFDDSAWSGPSPACLHIENSSPMPPNSFPPRNTVLPPGFVSPIARTYYFRTHFDFSGDIAGVSLTFSNFLDDGAVFYLNGAEIRRVRMAAAPTPITNVSTATGSPCSGDAYVACPDVFTISGTLVSANLLQGDNVIAVEVHNVITTATDVLFGSALIVNRPGSSIPRLFITSEDGLSLLSWNGAGFILQHSTDLSSPANWSDVPGPVTQSPALVTNTPTTFYRLRN